MAIGLSSDIVQYTGIGLLSGMRARVVLRPRLVARIDPRHYRVELHPRHRAQLVVSRLGPGAFEVTAFGVPRMPRLFRYRVIGRARGLV